MASGAPASFPAQLADCISAVLLESEAREFRVKELESVGAPAARSMAVLLLEPATVSVEATHVGLSGMRKRAAIGGIVWANVQLGGLNAPRCRFTGTSADIGAADVEQLSSIGCRLSDID